MSEDQVISWIFLATAIASEKEPTDFEGISIIADGINHAVPSQKEMQNSILFLSKKELVEKIGTKYKLTPRGKIEFEITANKSNNLLTIWKELEIQIKNYS